MAPIITPAAAEKTIMIARDASNFQYSTDSKTGIAFCTDKSVTIAIIISTISKVIILTSFWFLVGTGTFVAPVSN